MAIEERVKCKKDVYPAGSWQSYSCSRWAVKDGFCKQHDPGAVQARCDAQDLKCKQEREARVRREEARKLAKIDTLCERIEKFANYAEYGNRSLVDSIILEIRENGR